MNKIFKLAAIFVALSSMVFVSCEKEGAEDNGGEKPEKSMFKAKVVVSPDVVNACTSIVFEYKDAAGKLVSEDVDFSKLPVEKYEYIDSEYDVYVWTKNFEYTKLPAEVYFKPILTKNPEFTSDAKLNLLYSHQVKGADKSSSKIKATIGLDVIKYPNGIDSFLNIVHSYVLE